MPTKKKTKEITGFVIESDDELLKEENTIPTGSFYLNYNLSGNPNYGLLLGRIYEIYGGESTAKSSLAHNIAREFQKKFGPDKKVGVIDAERGFNKILAKGIGVDLSNYYINEPNSAEDAFQIMHDKLEDPDCPFGLFIVDSVDALIPDVVMEGQMDDNTVAALARVMSKGIRKTVSLAKKRSCAVIFINQEREKVGILFGNPRFTSGGNALKYYSWIRLNMLASSSKSNLIEIKNQFGQNEKVGVYVNVIAKKNKQYLPFKETPIKVHFGKPINKYLDLIELAVYLSIYKVSSVKKDKNIASGSGKQIIINNKAVSKSTYAKSLETDKKKLESILLKIEEKIGYKPNM